MRTKTSKRTYLNHSNQQLAEILLHSPFIKVSGQSPARHQLERLPLNLQEERDAFAHNQMLKELTHRLGSSAVTERMILCAAYDHLHYQHGTYILRICGADQIQKDETAPLEGVPVALVKRYTQKWMETQTNHQDWANWTISVLLEDGTTEIYIAVLLDIVTSIRNTNEAIHPR